MVEIPDEPTNADLMAALVKFHDEVMAEFAKTHRLLDEILRKPKQDVPDEGHPGPGTLRPFLIDDPDEPSGG